MSNAAALPDVVRCLLEILSERSEHDRALELDSDRWWTAQGERADPSYTLITGAVPFCGSVAKVPVPDLHSRRAELAAIAWTLQALAPGGRAVLLVPESVLAQSTRAHQALRRRLVEENRLQAVVRLAPGWYKPRSAASVLVVAKGGSSDHVWFCEARSPARPRTRRGSARTALATSGTASTEPAELAEVVARWSARSEATAAPRSAESFCVPCAEIAAQHFHLDMFRYRAAPALAEPSMLRPHEVLAEIAGLEAEIFQDLRALVGMLKPSSPDES